jgi:hypothetical protein
LKINKAWTNISNSTYTVHETPERPARFKLYSAERDSATRFSTSGLIMNQFPPNP